MGGARGGLEEKCSGAIANLKPKQEAAAELIQSFRFSTRGKRL